MSSEAKSAAPSSDANSPQAALTNFKKHITDLLSRLGDGTKDPITDLDVFRGTIEDVISSKIPEDFSRFFVNDALNKGLKAIMGRTYAQSTQVIEAVMSVFERTMDLFVARVAEDSLPLANALDTVMNDTLGFYRHYGLEKPDATTKPVLDDTEELQNFRKAIQFSDWIDVYSVSKNQWRAGQVVEVSDTQFKINYEGGSDLIGEYVARDSLRLAPLHSRSRDNIEPWRLELVENSKLDVLDTVSKWYTGSVVQVKGDLLFVNYDGWSSKFDEWIHRTSDRLAPLKQYAAGGKESGGTQHVYREKTIDDAADPEGVVAVYRGKEWSSWQFFNVVTYFGSKNGYHAIVQRVQQHSPNVSVALLRSYVDSVARATQLFAKPFITTLAPQFKDGVFDTVLGLNDADLRDLSKEHLEEIVKGVQGLLRRVDRSDNVKSVVEMFNLQAALRRFQSPIVERRINGMAYLCEVATRVKGYHARTSTITPAFLLQWLSENNVLEVVFGKNSHPELMKRSSDLLKLIAGENKLEKKHLDLVWDAIKTAMRRQDEATLTILYKVFDDFAYQLDSDQVNHLFLKMEEIPFEDYILSTLDLVKELSRLSYRAGPAAAEKATALLWGAIQDSSKASLDLQNHARAKLEEVMGDYSQRSYRFPYLHKCLENVKTHESVPQSLDVLRKILETFPQQPSTLDEHSKWTVINWMQTDLQFITIFFADFAHFKAQASRLIQEKSIPADSIAELVVSSRMGYLAQLKKRLSFLQFLLNNSGVKLNKDQVDAIWDSCYTNALCPEEREHCLYWLKTACDGKSKELMAFDSQIAEYLFNEKMTKGLDFADVTPTAYECLERYFIHINSAKGLLDFKGEESAGYAANTATSNGGEFAVLSFDLVGFDVIWRVALEAQRPRVVKASIAFLNNLHEKLSGDLRDQISHIRSEYIKKCMRHFKEYVDARDVSRIERCLSMLNHLLDASETKGIGRLRSHGAQLKGALLHINIQHNVAKTNDGKNKKMQITAYANDTLWELRDQIGKVLGMAADSCRIIHGGAELKTEQNSKKLSELKFAEPITLMVFKKTAAAQGRVDLCRNRDMVPLLKRALNEIFQKFATNSDGTMSKQDMANYIVACGAGEGSATPKRLSTIFTKFGDDDAGVLTANGFLDFYKDACIDRPDAVWNDLNCHGYRNDLRHEREVEDEANKVADNEKAMPRFLLASNPEYFNLLFHSLNLDDHTVASAIWSLVQRLPTNPTLRHNLVSLEMVQSPQPEWNALLDARSAYKLLYALQIIEGLTEPRDEEPAPPAEADAAGGELSRSQSAGDETEQVDPVAWRKKFLLSGGFKHLYQILVDYRNFIGNDAANAGMFELKKTCLELLLKMLRTFILGAISVNGPMLDIVQRVRGDSQADLPLESVSLEATAVPAAPPAPTEQPAPPAASAASEQTAAIEGASSNDLPPLILNNDDIYDDDIPPAPPVGGETDFIGPLPLEELKEKEQKDNDADKRAADELKKSQQRQANRNNGFRALVRQMSVGFADKLLEFVDVAVLQKTLLDLIKLTTSGAQASDADCKTVHYAGSLWVAIVCYRPDELLPRVYSELATLLPLLHCPASARIRKDLAQAFYHIAVLCKPERMPAAQSPHSVLLQTLPKIMPSHQDNPIDCGEQFWLHCELIKDLVSSRGAADAGAVDLPSLLDSVVKRLHDHVTAEQNETSKPDQVLIGLLKLCSVLSAHEPSFRARAGAPEHGNLITTVFENFLFQKNEDQPESADHRRKVRRPQDPRLPKCKTKASRSAAFRLLVTLCLSNPANQHQLLQLLSRQQRTVSQLSVYEYNPEKHTMSSVGYVGLRNLGSTCYMNSLLQQFYMIPHFRYGVLMCEDRSADKTDSLLYQMQTMFGFLACSEKQAYDTTPFCHAYKDENGRPINVRIQQDAQEFFNVLIDRLEKGLKGSAQHNVFRRLFGGTVVNQLICHGGCESVRESKEDYYTISLEVKGKNDIIDSLSSYVNGELLSDYNCSTCKRRVELHKRACIDTMSNTLIFHLKRFDLNFETFQHEKVNSRFAFPFEINMEPFTKEGRTRLDLENKAAALQAERASKDKSATAAADGKGGDDDGKGASGAEPAAEAPAAAGAEAPADAKTPEETVVVPAMYSVRPKEYYQYQLTGIIVHTGSAQAGHYYSFIRERGGQGRWLEFNDSIVRTFDTRRLEEECFGGEQQTMEANGYGQEYLRSSERVKNAYMLVYERVHPLPLVPATTPLSVSPPPQSAVISPSPSNSEVSIDRLRALVAEKDGQNAEEETFALIERCVSESRLRDVIPGNILSGVNEDNDQFLNDRQIFNPDYYTFMNEFISCATPPEVLALEPPAGTPNPGLEVIKLGTTFFLEVLDRAGENQVLPAFVENLKRLFKTNVPACVWFLETMEHRAQTLSELLLTVRDPIVRKAFVDVCTQVLTTVAPYDVSRFFVDTTVAASDKSQLDDTRGGQSKTVSAAPSVRFILAVIALHNECVKNWMRFSDYFELIFNFASLGPDHRRVLVQRKAIAILGDLYLGEHSPFEKDKKREKMGNRITQPDFRYMLKTMALLIRSCTTEAAGEAPPPTQMPGEPVPFSDTDKKVVMCRDLYIDAFANGHCPDAIGDIVAHWAFENWAYSETIINLLLAGIERAQSDTIKPYFDIMKPFCGVRDSLQVNRISRLLAPNTQRGLLPLLYSSRLQHGKLTYLAVKLLLGMIEDNEVFAQQMMANRTEWQWLDSWLKSFIGKKQYGPASNPPLARQESRDVTFSKYQAQLEKLGGTLAIGAASPVAGGASAHGGAPDPGAADYHYDNDLEQGRDRTGYSQLSDGNKRGRDPDDEMEQHGVRNVAGPYSRRMLGPTRLDTDFGSTDYSHNSVDPMSGAVVPVGQVVDNPVRAKWNCPTCTFENEGMDLMCAMCAQGSRP